MITPCHNDTVSLCCHNKANGNSPLNSYNNTVWINKFETITYGLLLGGIYGNLIDRILYGYVIDYLDFTIFGYNFAVFNLADILIVGTIFLLLINSFKKGGNNGKNSCKWWRD